MSKKTKEELEKDVKDVIKVNNRNVIEYQKVDKENIQLNKILKDKEEEIYNLRKSNTEKECTCSKYKQSMDDVVMHASKNKEAVVTLRTLAENQKVKISSLREEKYKLLEEIDQLELNARTDHDNIMKTHRENVNLKENIKALETEIDEKQSLDYEDKIKALQIEVISLSRKNADLEDEILTKDVEILKSSEVIEKYEFKEMNTITSVSNTLENEMKCSKGDLELENRIKELEAKIKTLQGNKIERGNLLNKMKELSELRETDLENLKHSVQKIKKSKIQDCKFGHDCKRKFCHFSHKFLFVKDNRNLHHKARGVYSCSLCDNSFGRKEHLEVHIRAQHSGNHKCDDVSLKSLSIKKHMKNQHKAEAIPINRTLNKANIDEADSEYDKVETCSESDVSEESFEESSNDETSETESGEVSSN